MCKGLRCLQGDGRGSERLTKLVGLQQQTLHNSWALTESPVSNKIFCSKGCDQMCLERATQGCQVGNALNRLEWVWVEQAGITQVRGDRGLDP